jgi:Polyketide cyclase / dehydrase and lipid transport
VLYAGAHARSCAAMHPMTTRTRSTASVVPHAIAGTLALLYAWHISNTAYVTTGVQFVSPLAIILLVHLAWTGARRELIPGYAKTVMSRSLVTALGIIACTVFAVAYAPMPVEAASGLGELVGGILGTIACLAVLALVVGAAAMVIYAGVWIVTGLFDLLMRWFDRPPGAGGSRLFDLDVVMLALLAIGAASLEGVTGALTFAARDSASSAVTVAAAPARVWHEVGRATSPIFPLPILLKSIPQPVAVLVDEGAAVGARRIVHFTGREGEGDLTLQVTQRTANEVVFTALSDTSPIAMWIRQKSLTFRVEPDGTGSRLTVTSDYDRLLAPAWFFRPYVRVASYLAVDVLARDTKQRAEALAHNGAKP